MNLTKKQLEAIKTYYSLSNRQIQIVELMLSGIESNQDLAKSIGITTATLKVYMRHLYAKLGVNSKMRAVVLLYDFLQGMPKS
jgi:DNA-binding CsgD family transcriptional regulator